MFSDNDRDGLAKTLTLHFQAMLSKNYFHYANVGFKAAKTI